MPLTGPPGPTQQPPRSTTSLGVEGSKLASEISKVGNMIQTTLAQLESTMKAAAGKAAPPPPTPIGDLVLKMAFAAILHDASEKAMSGKAFNLEAAINDLWTKFEALRGVARMASKTAAMAAKGIAATAAHDLEMAKLKKMVEKRSQMFDALSEVMKAHDQSAKNVIQNMR